jgi:hypothetical protein
MASNKEIVEDYLEADPPVRGQNYVCLSFISPEKVLKNKEVFKVTKFLEFLFKDTHTKDENGQVVPSPGQLAREKLIKDPSSINYQFVNEIYEDWKYNRDEALENDYREANDFITSTRGLKIRGVYESEREAKVRAQVLQRRDPNFNVFVGQVGYWLPWDPSPDNVADQEYGDSALNELVKKYKENIQQRDDHYEEVKRMKLEKIRKENEEKRRALMESGVTGSHLHNAEDSKKNIEALREAVDRADKGEKGEETSTNSGSFLEKDTSVGAPVEENGSSVSEQMKGLEEMDPWMRRKLEEEARKEREMSASLENNA